MGYVFITAITYFSYSWVIGAAEEGAPVCNGRIDHYIICAGWTHDFELLLTHLPCFPGLPAQSRRSHGAYLCFHAGSNRSRRYPSAKERKIRV
ncbi:hypothetical protein PsorP6_013401 [Peronosclerospora sorghi]|uniref:Uncharacterized protein n=1 Tax=Peronosclerospora sorghi TaxID=230839 RepID=A0ACC0WHH8_9STRA|nr:hypothetical protein PsorP6_013401 [Peronosclerospora sorghi]